MKKKSGEATVSVNGGPAVPLDALEAAMKQLHRQREYRCWAEAASTAWLNAAIAVSNDEIRGVLYRTLSVEFFPAGVQFVGCDGTMLFRTWTPFCDIGDLPATIPDWFDRPRDSVVVIDHDKFALGFMRTLLSVSGDAGVEMVFTIEPAPMETEPPLGEEVTAYVLTIRALGQQLSCKLFDGPYTNWRALDFGIDRAELVDGLTISSRMFAAVGKLKAVYGIDCTFTGDAKAIQFSSGDQIRGLLMPMRRPEKPKARDRQDDQLEHEEEADADAELVAAE
jgi:hypothetical protein